LKLVDPTGLTETAYYWTGNPNDERKKYFQEHIQEILKAVKAMAKDAGIKDVATLAFK
jgi:hypothetical protein